MRLKNFILIGSILFFVIILLVNISSQTIPTGTCNVMPANNCPTTTGLFVVMHLAASTNSHGELATQTNYANDYVLCCQGFTGIAGLTSQCTDAQGNSNKIIGLAMPTNSHAEIPSNTNYINNVCYNGVWGCRSQPTCAGNQVSMVSLSSTSNAHIATFGAPSYTTNICCFQEIALSNGGTVGGCTITDAYWSLSNNPTKIDSSSSAFQGQLVYLVVTGTPGCISQNIGFNVMDSQGNIVSKNPINATFSNGNGVAIGNWSAQYGSNPSYSFVATLNGSIPSPSSQMWSNTNNLNLTVNQELIDQYCSNSNIVSCNSYNQSICSSATNPDPCNVAQNSVNLPPGASCDGVNYGCSCAWNQNSAVCNANYIAYNIRGTNQNGQCTFTTNPKSSTGSCSTSGYITYAWTAVWSGYGPAPQNCVSGQKTLQCPAQVALPFFGFYNFAITILIIAVIYTVIILRGKIRKEFNKITKIRKE